MTTESPHRKPWTEFLMEDEQALVGSGPVIDRLLERLAYERYGAEIMRPVYQASREAYYADQRALTAVDMDWGVSVMAERESSGEAQRSRDCEHRGHDWTGPHPAEATGLHRWPYLRCSHCLCTSAARQHSLTEVPKEHPQR